MVYFIWKVGAIMRNDKLSVQSMDFAVSIINLVKFLNPSDDMVDFLGHRFKIYTNF